MKLVRSALLASVTAASLVLASCSSAEDSSEATTAATTAAATSTAADAAAATGELVLEDNEGTKTIALPIERVAVTDNRAFEVLTTWGVEVVAAPLALVPAPLRDKLNEDTVAGNLGNHREPDLEALVAAQPDFVWNGQRFRDYQDDIHTLLPEVPVVIFEPRDGEALDEELIRHTEALGKVFDREDDAAKLIADFQEAIKRAQDAYDPESTVMAVNTSGGEIGYIAPGNGRTLGPIFDLLNLTPALEIEGGSDDHQGDDISVEAIAQSNPDWIFILDRDGAMTNLDSYTPGEDLVRNNPALVNVTAVSQGNIIVAPADTYLNESIITYTEILNAIADAFEAQKS